MEKAALEGVDAHDGFGLVAEALLHHQLRHVLLLDLDVTALHAHNTIATLSCGTLTPLHAPLP